MAWKRTLRIVMTASVLLGAASGAGAHSRDQRKFERLYRLESGSPLFYAGCHTCHGTSRRSLNPYGRALRRARKAGKEPDVEAFRSIEDLDSDYDSVTNGQEIQRGTKPGDSESHP